MAEVEGCAECGALGDARQGQSGLAVSPVASLVVSLQDAVPLPGFTCEKEVLGEENGGCGLKGVG